MSANNAFARLRTKYRKQVGLTTFRALLGDSSHVLDEPGKVGYVRVRYTQAAGLSQPTTVRFRANIPKIIDAPVLVGYDRSGELAVIDADFDAQLASGMNPLGNQATDPNVSYFVTQSQITTLLSTPISSASDSMLVTVWPFWYILDGTLHHFAGGNGDSSPIDLTAYIPGSSDEQCVAVLFLLDDDTVEVQTSTPIDIGDDIGIGDIQECIDNASSNALVAIHVWRLYNGQTGILDATPDNGGDNVLDLRQLITLALASASGSSDLPVRATCWADVFDQPDGTPGIFPTHFASQDTYFYAFQTTGANGDSFQFKAPLAAGTYTFRILGVKSSNGGKYDVYVDGVITAVTGLDFYSSPDTYNAVLSGSITIASDGLHTFKCLANGKNASSSGFYWFVSKVEIY